MKKYILIMIIIFGMPAWALCSIGDGESVCTLPNSDSGMTSFQSPNTSGLNMNKDSMPSSSLKSTNSGSSFNRMQNQSGIKMQGSLGCQFGNCNKENTNDFLPNQ